MVWPWVVALFLATALTACGRSGLACLGGVVLGILVLSALLLPDGERTQDTP